jgi:hypothetical protein
MILPKSIGFHAWKPAAWLRVTGGDAAGFLQGQFTNDVRLAQPGRAIYGLWLNQKGRVLADSFIIRGQTDAEFFVGSYFSAAQVIVGRLEAYIVADDVAVEDLTLGWTGAALIGEGAEGWLGAKDRPGAVFAGRRLSGESWEWVMPDAAWEAALAGLAGGLQIGTPEMERLRIVSGIPAVPADAGPGDLPNEANLGSEAISGTKGCYLGQEVVARLKSRGRVRRRLLRVAGPGSPPALPAPLWQQGRAAGELRSCAPDESGGGLVGLAMLVLDQLRPDAPLGFPGDGVPALAIEPGQL